MGDPAVQERVSQDPQAADLCCEPECGPETCGSGETVELVEKPAPVATAECCEPECGPDTCG